MDIEQQGNNEITKTDLPYQVVGKYFGAKSDGESSVIWNDITKDNKDWLAKMTGTGVWSGTAIENTAIADNLRANRVASFYDYDENASKINDFYKVKEMYQSKNLSDLKTFQYYISNLNEAQITTLNTLSTEQRTLFIIEQCQNVDTTQSSIQSKVESGGSIENKNLAVIKELLNMQEKLENFIEKYSSETPMLAHFKRKEGEKKQREGFVDEATEKEFQLFFEEQKSTEEYKKFIAEYSEDVAQEHYRQLFIVKAIDMDSLSEEAKREFADIVIDIHDQANKFGIDLVKMGFDTLYTEAIKVYQSTDMYTQLSSKVLSDDEFNTYFDDKEGNKVEKLVADEKKSVEYYKNLIKLYPDMDTTNISTMFTEDYFTLT